jgi:hypothetical protein
MMTENYNDGQQLDSNEGVENSAVYPKYSMFTAMTMMNDEYAVEMDDDTFVERAYKIWKNIGNEAQAWHILKAKVDGEKRIWLPNNAEQVASVSSMDVFKDVWGSDLVIFNNGSLMLSAEYFVAVVTNRLMVNSILDNRRNRIEGLFVDFTHHGDHIQFKSKDLIGTHMVVLFKGVISDDYGLPKITYRESEAIAAGVAFIHYKKLALLGDSAAAAMLEFLKEEKDRLTTQARMPEHLTENQMNRILDTNSSFDRKGYHRSYKYNGY